MKFLLYLGFRAALCSSSSFCKLEFGMGKGECIASSDVTRVHDDYSDYELMYKNFSSIIKIPIWEFKQSVLHSSIFCKRKLEIDQGAKSSAYSQEKPSPVEVYTGKILLWHLNKNAPRHSNLCSAWVLAIDVKATYDKRSWKEYKPIGNQVL